MPYRIAVCDDNIYDRCLLSDYLMSYDDSYKIFTYSSGDTLLYDIKECMLFDIIFLDIYMPGLNGIETAREIRNTLEDVKIIITTTSTDHYPEAYAVFAYNYLVKPVMTDKLKTVMDRAVRDLETDLSGQLTFSYKSANYRIRFKEILYIESHDKTVFFYLVNQKALSCYAKMDEILAKVPHESFLRCHQSYAVNMLHIDRMGEHCFYIGEKQISISKKYMKESKDKYYRYLFSRMEFIG